MCFNTKKIISVLLSITMILSIASVPAFATETQTIIASGSSGKETTWTLSDTGVLTISGTGATGSYIACSPWDDYAENIKTVVIEEGITYYSIGYVGNMLNVEKVYYPSTLIYLRSPIGVESGKLKSAGPIGSGCDIEFAWNASIIADAFCNLKSLESIILSEGITSIGASAFAGCANLKEINLPNSLTTIGAEAFRGCTMLSEVIIPNVSVLERSAFKGCTNLKKVTLSENLTKITSDLFSGCKALSNIILPNNITSIESQYGGAFTDSGLTSINIPAKVTTIGEASFDDCADMVSINVDSENSTFSSKDGCLYNKDLTKLIIVPKAKHGDLVIPENVSEISGGAIENCINLASVTLPKNYTNAIMAYNNKSGNPLNMFVGCTNLKNIYVDAENETYVSIDGIVYSKDKSTLTRVPVGKDFVDIPISVTSIDIMALKGCDKIEDIYISNNITSIKSDVFTACNNLNNIYYEGTEEQWVSINTSTIPENTTIHYNYIIPTSVSLDKSIATITEGNNLKLNASVVPSNATNQTVTWSSSNESVATVSNGVITAKAAGTATITVTTVDGGKTANCEVTVNAATVSVTGISLNKTSTNLTVGGVETLAATVAPSNATNRSVSWKSSNTSIATVSNGKVTAISAGTAVITATTTDGGYTANCTVTVTEKVIDENAPRITITDIKTMPGKEIQVTVDLANNTGFASLGIEVGYNSDIMTLTNVTSNTGVGGTFTKAQYLTVNPFNMGWDSASNITYNGNLATLTFTVGEDVADGIYPITLDYYKGVKGNYVDGDNINYDENFEAVGFVYISGNVIVASYIPGDINGDESVDNKDATYLLRYLAGWSISGLAEDALDVDGSTSVDNKDATILLRYLAGWNVTLH